MVLSDLLQFPHFIIIIIGIMHLTIAIILVIVHKPKNWYSLHVFFATSGIELIVIGVGILIDLTLTLPHAILGLTVIFILVSEIVGGIIARKLKKREIRLIHIWVGRILYISIFVVVILGISYFI
ncbi:MAG: hypothetical protein ACFFA3_20015 [Promethearchaeota archaeon]